LLPLLPQALSAGTVRRAALMLESTKLRLDIPREAWRPAPASALRGPEVLSVVTWEFLSEEARAAKIRV
jgi:hypothetical protein